MKVATRSAVTHTHTISAEEKRTDGGRALLLELFDDVREDKRVGQLVAQFGVGGSISDLKFVETESIKQNEIEVEPKPPKITFLAQR